jgi:hypothetical protein
MLAGVWTAYKAFYFVQNTGKMGIHESTFRTTALFPGKYFVQLFYTLLN